MWKYYGSPERYYTMIIEPLDLTALQDACLALLVICESSAGNIRIPMSFFFLELCIVNGALSHKISTLNLDRAGIAQHLAIV